MIALALTIGIVVVALLGLGLLRAAGRPVPCELCGQPAMWCMVGGVGRFLCCGCFDREIEQQ